MAPIDCGRNEGLVADLERYIPALMKRKHVEGLSVAVIREARTAWAAGFGIRDVRTGETVSPDTVFEGASFSKPAAAYVALKMCEAGLLELDRPLDEYAPRSIVPDDPRCSRVTARMVLSHTSGLSHDDPPRILFSPGERFMYSACGFEYLQMAIEHLSGMPFAECMRTHLLEPLGMRSSSFIWDGESALEFARGHEGGEAQKKWTSREANAAATLHTTPSDFARLLMVIMQPDNRDRFHLGVDGCREMLSSQVSVTDSLHWGLGWGIHRGRDIDSFWHWGWWHGFRNFAAGYPETLSGLVIMTNSDNGLNACDDLVAHVTGGEYPAFPWIDTR